MSSREAEIDKLILAYACERGYNHVTDALFEDSPTIKEMPKTVDLSVCQLFNHSLTSIVETFTRVKTGVFELFSAI